MVGYSVVSNQNHVRNVPSAVKNTVNPTNRTRPIQRMRRFRRDARMPVRAVTTTPWGS